MHQGLRGWSGVVLLGCADGPRATTPTPTPGPLLSLAWTAESDQASAALGAAVASAGDVNGDGFADIAVGAPYHDGASTDEGRAWIYHGSADGPSATPAWTGGADQAGAWFGLAVASAGDVDRDGYDDVVVGAPLYDGGSADGGRAFLYRGAASGLSTEPAWTAESDRAGAAFGIRVAGAGDVNGDGFADVAIGASHSDGGSSNEGRADVWLGSSSGLGPVPDWSAEPNQTGAYFGAWVAGAGDVDGDGFDDLVVTAPLLDAPTTDEGHAYVFLGSADGLEATPSWGAESDQASAYFGTSAAGAGDVDGDGYADLVVGAPDFDAGQLGEGRIYLYLGAPDGLEAAAWTAESDRAYADYGSWVATAGDVDGDGFDDVLVGASQDDRVYLHRGSAGGLDADPAWIAHAPDLAPVASITGTDRGFEYAVSSAGDVDADGFDDVIVGAPDATAGEENEGVAYLYLATGR